MTEKEMAAGDKSQKGEIPDANLPEADYKPEDDDENYESSGVNAEEKKNGGANLDQSAGQISNQDP